MINKWWGRLNKIEKILVILYTPFFLAALFYNPRLTIFSFIVGFAIGRILKMVDN